MHDDDLEIDSEGFAFRDLLMLILSGFVVCMVILLTQVARKAEANNQEAKSTGNMYVVAIWLPGDLDVDVDLWVQAPGDIPVGYSNKGGAYFNLLRDDLGNQLDTSHTNRENAFARDTPDGEYTVNLHLYRNRSDLGEIPVHVSVSTKQDGGGMREILVSDVKLDHEGEELTVFRFSLKDGQLDRDSITTLPKPLRSAFKSVK